MRRAASSVISWPSKYRSVASPPACPPLTITACGPSSRRSRAAARRSSRVAMLRFSSTSASGRLGVMIAARGSSFVRSASTASSRSSLAPPLATITGSTTSRVIPWSLMAFATASMISADESMPVLAARTSRSLTTASICARMRSVGSSRIWVTSTVFCAVIAVMAEVPCTPSAANVFRSAWMPAPPPESDPAMVRATGSFMLGAGPHRRPRRRRCSQGR